MSNIANAGGGVNPPKRSKFRPMSMAELDALTHAEWMELDPAYARNVTCLRAAHPNATDAEIEAMAAKPRDLELLADEQADLEPWERDPDVQEWIERVEADAEAWERSCAIYVETPQYQLDRESWAKRNFLQSFSEADPAAALQLWNQALKDIGQPLIDTALGSNIHVKLRELLKDTYGEPEPSDRTSRYAVHWRGEYRNRAPAALLIEDLYLPQTGLGMIAAPSGSFKSFIAAELCMAVATGRPAFGTFKVSLTGTAIYAAGEGSRGIEDQRVLAYERDAGQGFDLDAYPFGTVRGLPVAANQTDVDEFLAGIDAAVKAQGKPLRLVVLDTLNKMMPGMDENAAGTMSAVLHAVAEALVHRYGCLVLIVHHFGKDKSKGARGSTASVAALDWYAEIEAAKDRLSDLYLADLMIAKDKDGDGEGEHVYLRGRQVALGRNTPKRDHSLVFKAITESEHEALRAGVKSADPAGGDDMTLAARAGRALMKLGTAGERMRLSALVLQMIDDIGDRSIGADRERIVKNLSVRIKKQLEAGDLRLLGLAEDRRGKPKTAPWFFIVPRGTPQGGSDDD